MKIEKLNSQNFIIDDRKETDIQLAKKINETIEAFNHLKKEQDIAVDYIAEAKIRIDNLENKMKIEKLNSQESQFAVVDKINELIDKVNNIAYEQERHTALLNAINARFDIVPPPLFEDRFKKIENKLAKLEIAQKEKNIQYFLNSLPKECFADPSDETIERWKRNTTENKLQWILKNPSQKEKEE